MPAKVVSWPSVRLWLYAHYVFGIFLISHFQYFICASNDNDSFANITCKINCNDLVKERYRLV
jgi:hypothetical protein